MPRRKPAPGKRIEPVAALPEAAKTIWKGITDALPADFYGPQDRHLLAQYCYAVWRGEREIARDRRKAGSADPAVIRESVRVLGKLGPQLRLAPSSRIEPKTAATGMRRAKTEQRPEAAESHDWRAELGQVH